MSCNCRKDIEDKLLNHFIEQHPSAVGHTVRLTGYAFMCSKNRLDMKGVMPFEMTAKFPLKKGGLKEKTQKQNMVFNYCPFCGEKYPKEDEASNDQ